MVLLLNFDVQDSCAGPIYGKFLTQKTYLENHSWSGISCWGWWLKSGLFVLQLSTSSVEQLFPRRARAILFFACLRLQPVRFHFSFANRQTDKQTNRQTDKTIHVCLHPVRFHFTFANRQTDKQANRQKQSIVCLHPVRFYFTFANRHTDKQANRQNNPLFVSTQWYFI